MMSSSWISISFGFFIFSLSCMNPAFSTSSDTNVSYADHCSSIVHEASSAFCTCKNSIPDTYASFFTGGDKILDLQSFKSNSYYVGKYLGIQILPDYSATTDTCICKVAGFLKIQFPYMDVKGNGEDDNDRSNLTFSLNGFWSEDSRKLCMVGSASWKVERGNVIYLDAVLKMNYASDHPTLHTSVVSGILESTMPVNDPGYFDPISIFSFPELNNYNYSTVSEELGGVLPSDSGVPKNQSLNIRPALFCSLFMWKERVLKLEYAKGCKAHCSPLGSRDGFSPPVLALSQIQCLMGERKLRFLAKFRNVSYSDPTFGSTLIGEAMWDEKSNQMYGILCRIADPSRSSGNRVGDCTMRLTLRYPSIQTIINISPRIVGRFWSTKSVEDLTYFRRINLVSTTNDITVEGLRYEYTKLDRVRTLCSERKGSTNTYPAADSDEMRFGMSMKNSKGQDSLRAYARPLFVGNMLFNTNTVMSESGTTNISYKISFYPSSHISLSNSIVAEGVYDAEAGLLCMVGCRKLVVNSTSIVRDCEILVQVEFARFDEDEGVFCKGTVESTRAAEDPFYFQNVSFSSTDLPIHLLRRMDSEMNVF